MVNGQENGGMKCVLDFTHRIFSINLLLFCVSTIKCIPYIGRRKSFLVQFISDIIDSKAHAELSFSLTVQCVALDSYMWIHVMHIHNDGQMAAWPLIRFSCRS